MTSFISHAHAEFRKARLTRRGATQAQGDVPMGLCKEYPRMEKIALPKARQVTMTLPQSLESRASYNEGTDASKLSLDDCGTLFGLALGKHEGSLRRNYPSGGALYPIETYLVTQALEESGPAVFHYNPNIHALEKLWEMPRDLPLKDLVKQPPDLLFSSLIVFTAVWKRSSAKYGDFTYTPALLEAGHMSENILLVSTALGLKTRPMAGFDDDLLISLLDLDPEDEQPVHTIAMC